MTTRNYFILDSYNDIKGKVHANNRRNAMIKFFKEHSDIYKDVLIMPVSKRTGELIASALNTTYGENGQIEMLICE